MPKAPTPTAAPTKAPAVLSLPAPIGPGYSVYQVSRLGNDLEFTVIGNYQARSVQGAVKKALAIPSSPSAWVLTELPQVTGSEHPHRHNVKVVRGSYTQRIQVVNLTAQEGGQ